MSQSSQATPQAIPMMKTSTIGSATVGTPFDIKSPAKPVKWVQACWDGEVIKGLALRFHDDDDKLYTVGDWNNTHELFHRSTLEIARDDFFNAFKGSTASFGYGSVRGIFLQPRSMAKQPGDVWWNAGNVTDAPSYFDVSNRYWMGIFGTLNPDQFINSLGLWVSAKQ